MKKIKSLWMHTRKRGLSRYGLNISKADHGEMVRQIQNGESVCFESQSLSRTKHVVRLNGTRIPVVYDKNRKVIITILPPEALKEIDTDDNDGPTNRNTRE